MPWIASLAEERYGHPAVVLRRAELVEMLAANLPPGSLRLGTQVTGLDEETGGITLEGAEVLHAVLLVAADGIRSAARTALFPGHPGPAYAGLTAWQALVPSDGIDYLMGATPVPDVIGRIDAEAVLRADIHSMRVPLPAFHRAKAAILGDAAHAMAPNLGQGACQAIEDAVTLAYCLDGWGTISDGLADYTAARMPRTSLIVRRSEQVARFATMRNPAGQVLRNGMLRAMGLLGSSAALRQADFVMRWDHPAVAAPPRR